MKRVGFFMLMILVTFSCVRNMNVDQPKTSESANSASEEKSCSWEILKSMPPQIRGECDAAKVCLEGQIPLEFYPKDGTIKVLADKAELKVAEFTYNSAKNLIVLDESLCPTSAVKFYVNYVQSMIPPKG